MGLLGLGEPGLGTLIIFLGAWINRDFKTPLIRTVDNPYLHFAKDVREEMGLRSMSRENESSNGQTWWRHRDMSLFGYIKTIKTPDTAVFRTRILSRVLLRFPFIIEMVYWFLIYGVYQFGRGQLAIRFVDQTIGVASYHALAVIDLEKRVHIFWEPSIQHFLLQYPDIMWWINREYSYVHLPGTISFLVGLYYFAITRNRSTKESHWHIERTNGPELYESRRRALALCNLLAFCVFSTWPCMPPRLLGESTLSGEAGKLARSFDFVDTVHARNGAVSVFNTRKYTNQLAAMPSLHFGYSLLIGVSIMRLPLAHSSKRFELSLPFYANARFHMRLPSYPETLSQVVGFLYPFTILVAIIATANHFILDAVAGGLICMFALRYNRFMKNLLPLEDCIFWCLRIHKPVPHTIPQEALFDDKSRSVIQQ